MLKNIKELSKTTEYKAEYESKTVIFSFTKDQFDWQGQYKILEYNGSKQIPKDLEKKLLDLCEEIDFGEVELI